MEKKLEDALKIVLDKLEYENNHTVGKLLYWAFYEDKMTDEKALQAYEAWLLARDFMYYGKTCDNTEEIKWYALWLETRKEYA